MKWLSILLLLLSLPNFAQKITVFGIISDSEQIPVVGASILDLNTNTGAISDLDGNFIIETEIGNKILISYLGFQDKEIIVQNESQNLNLVLDEDVNTLNQVVVSASRRKEKILDAPASISTIDAKEINNRVAVAPPDLLKATTSVDIMKTGLQSANVVVRGFNNPFSTDLLTMSDNRLTRVPSLRINAFQMIPTTADDIERIEVLRGAASALYGPNSSNGVVHFITRSPIDFQQSKVSFGMGLRSKISGDVIDSENSNSVLRDDSAINKRTMYQAGFYHAQKLTKDERYFQAGYKVSGNYFSGYDWKYKDPFEPDTIIKGYQTYLGRVDFYEDGLEVPADSLNNGVRGDFVDNRRDNQIDKISLDGRVDFRLGKDFEAILSGGFTNVSNVELAPLGSIQAIDWTNWYTQTRFIYKDLFAQFYVNGNNAGDSYFLRTGDVNRDRSKIYASQVQHSLDPTNRVKLIYGLDAFFTRPDTRNTINGRFEDDDNINEYGAYAHADVKINSRMSAVGALRFDHHSRVGGLFFSPRLAFLYKPSPKNTFRLTFNRSFKTPGSGGFFADALSASLPTNIDIRVIGNVDGFQYRYNENPFFENQILPQFQSPYATNANDFLNVGDQSINDAAWNDILAITVSEFAALFENNEAGINVDLIGTLIQSLLPDTLNNVGHEVKTLNLTTRQFENASWENTNDVIPLKNVETYTYEVGYKGILADFIFLDANVYYSQVKDFLAPTTLITNNVVLNTDDLLEYLGPTLDGLIGALDNFENLVERLDGLEGYGELNGTIDDEIKNAIISAAGNLPIGTISPENIEGPTMVLATRNIGDLDIWGFDLDAKFYLSEQLKLSTSYAYVSKDSIELENSESGFIALNAPRHKVRFGVNYDFKKIGLNVGTGWRWQAGFPANAGVFVGYVENFHDMDLNVSWTPNFFENMNLTLSIQNLYNNEHQFFVGAPEIGRTGMLRLSYKL